jgi:hypothetical protein
MNRLSANSLEKFKNTALVRIDLEAQEDVLQSSLRRQVRVEDEEGKRSGKVQGLSPEVLSEIFKVNSHQANLHEGVENEETRSQK